jgi:RsiW-degrading membrane proteinase PrsW (M82 family)
MQSGNYRPDPSEWRVRPGSGKTDDLERIRDSVFNEPVHTREHGGREFRAWLEERQRLASRPRSLAFSLLAAAAGGPFAVIGAMATGRQTAFAVVYLVLFGPVFEELLKLSGIIFLLERQPYRVFSRWQLMVGACLGALLFACIENLVYNHVYLAAMPPGQLAAVAAYRWRVCTSLHVFCSAVAALGMIRVWQRVLLRGEPAELSDAFPYIGAAIGIHGAYNLIAVLVSDAWGF